MNIRAALLFLCCGLISAAAAAPVPERLEQRVTLTTDDGWNLSARYLASAPGAPTVIFIHTQKSDMTEWENWFKPMRRYGFGYLAMDLRGHGNSFVTPDGSTASWKSFALSGSDNEYNKMLRDVDAALAYLSTTSVTGQIVLAGSVLGANLAIKAAAIHPEVAMVIALSPALNVNDVLSVNPLRAYGKRPLLIVAGADKERQYKEFQLINDIAKTACGKTNVTVIVEAKGIGPSLITKYNVRRLLDWIKNPRLPEVVEFSTAAPAGLLPEPGDAGEPADTAMPDFSQE
ncbi:MAG TPA: alpha/beta hydrolase [Elusimicrobiales bacterium]|nr:alpha/beta hydrolase [Elusimicrobiales bacterium]